jgi:hypothetical protein
MQVARSRRARSLLAIAASAWLVLTGVLGLRHEAEVGHAIDAAGVAVHGSVAIGHHGAAACHLHTRAAAHDGDGACEVIAAVHQAGAATARIELVAAAPAGVAIGMPRPVAGALAPLALLRLAPKTSPPPA